MKSTSLLIAALIALIVLVTSSLSFAGLPPDPGLDGFNGDVGVSSDFDVEVITATISGVGQRSRLQPQEAIVSESNPVDLRPAIGDIVLYQVGHAAGGVLLRPAIVVDDWRELTNGDPEHPYAEEGIVNLQVFLDGHNDFDSEFPADERQRGLAWRTSVPKGEPGQASTWLPKT